MSDYDDIFEEFIYVPFDEPVRSPDTGMLYTHMAVPKSSATPDQLNRAEEIYKS